jgi:hypothetical protein
MALTELLTELLTAATYRRTIAAQSPLNRRSIAERLRLGPVIEEPDQQQSSADLSSLSGFGSQPIPAMSRRCRKPLR